MLTEREFFLLLPLLIFLQGKAESENQTIIINNKNKQIPGNVAHGEGAG